MNETIRRIYLGAIVPAPIGAALYLIYVNALGRLGLQELTYVFMVMVYNAYIYAGIQSIIYSFLMEFLVNRKLTNGYIVILIAGLLGAISIGVLHIGAVNERLMYPSFIVIGGLTGLIVGAWLRFIYIDSANGLDVDDDRCA